MKIKKYSLIIALTIFSLLVARGAQAGLPVQDCGSDQLVYDTGTGLCVHDPSNAQGVAGSVSINDLVIRIINVMLMVAAIIAVLFIVIGGFRYITSNGNEEAAKKGRKTLIYALVGLAIVIVSYTLVSIVNNAVSNCGGFGSIFFGC